MSLLMMLDDEVQSAVFLEQIAVPVNSQLLLLNVTQQGFLMREAYRVLPSSPLLKPAVGRWSRQFHPSTLALTQIAHRRDDLHGTHLQAFTYHVTKPVLFIKYFTRTTLPLQRPIIGSTSPHPQFRLFFESMDYNLSKYTFFISLEYLNLFSQLLCSSK